MSHIREKLAWGLFAALGLFVVASMTGVVSGGPLDPPGPPASTDSVRLPGTPISSLPFSITQPGYYYVTRDLTAPASQHGITIASDDVTVDLGGFTLRAGDTPSYYAGIATYTVPGPRGARNLEIRNGAFVGWGAGIYSNETTNSKIHDITVLGSTNTGIDLTFSYDVQVWNCHVSDSNGAGIEINNGTVRNCAVTDNGGWGIFAAGRSLVEGNEIHNNPTIGLFIIGDNGVFRANSISGSATDVSVDNSADGVTLQGNVYCNLAVGAGLGLTDLDNVDRTTC